MQNQNFITDIFGNLIEVTNLKDAITQTKQFAHMSKENNIVFTEFYFENAIDTHGKRFKAKKTPKNPKEVTSLDYYNHQLKELLKINN